MLELDYKSKIDYQVMKVKKAVIPAAGVGTRFLPITKSIPKEMLPIFDRPMLQYSIEQAAQAGIEHVVLVISSGKESISTYFGSQPALKNLLKDKNQLDSLEQIKRIEDLVEISYVYQKQQLGLGHAVMAAKTIIGNDPFAVFLPDEVSWSAKPSIGQLIEIFNQYNSSVIGIREVPPTSVSSLGIIKPRQIANNLFEVMGLIEKPSFEEAPSNLGITGPYVLTPEVFESIGHIQPGVLGEIQLTDAIALLMQRQKVYACIVNGVRIDAGHPLGLLKASIHEALQRENVSYELRDWLKNKLS